MKKVVLGISMSLVFGLSGLVACSMLEPFSIDTFFPKTVGKFNRNGEPVVPKTNSMDGRIVIPSRYDYKDGNTSQTLYYALVVLNKAGDAQIEHENGISICSKKLATTGNSIEIVKDEKLKDKSGIDIGGITVCQDKSTKRYSVSFFNDRYAAIVADQSSKPNISLTDLADFVKTLPINSKIDFSAFSF